MPSPTQPTPKLHADGTPRTVEEKYPYPSQVAAREKGAEGGRGYETGRGSAGGTRASREYVCQHCAREFTAKPVHDERRVADRKFCSNVCYAAECSADAAPVQLLAQSQPA